MRAVVWTEYGPPEGLKLRELEKPVPRDDEVLVRIYATSVFTGDCEMRALKFPFYFKIPLRLYLGLRKPRGDVILGQELSGEIEAVGNEVTKFEPGDRVFAATGFDMGGYAEYKIFPETPKEEVIVQKPANISFEEAATLPVGGLNALYFIRKANIQAGQKVLIIGAGGSIGTVAIQLAKSLGAEVTAIDIGSKLQFLSSIGADHVIDYTKTDFSKQGILYDVVFDVAGKTPVYRDLRVLKKEGTLLLANPRIRHIVRGKLTTLLTSKKVTAGTVRYKEEDLLYLKQLIEDGVLKPVIDKIYSIEEIVEAHKYVDSGDKKGNVAIRVTNGE